MPLTTEERSLRASRARVKNARRRRFQRYLQEMRDAGLVVEVSIDDYSDVPKVAHPDYTEQAVWKALGR